MQAGKHYSRAPITEALIDIQVQLPEEVKLDVLAQVYSSIQTEYPKREEMLVFQGQMIAGASVGATASQSQIGYRTFSKCVWTASPSVALLPTTAGKHSEMKQSDCGVSISRWQIQQPLLG
jgi:hypothetical protein